MNPILEEILATREVVTPAGERLPLHSEIPREEGELLQRIVRRVRPAVSVEIGLAYGVSALYLCEALAEVGAERHIVVDPYQTDQWQGVGLANLRRAGYGELVEFLEAPSHLALSDLERRGQRVDFAFVDGRHTFDNALVDFFHVDRLLNVWGHIVFDDTNWPGLLRTCRFIVTNRAYQVERMLAPKVVESELVPSDADLGLDRRARCTAFRKLGEDERPARHAWDGSFRAF